MIKLIKLITSLYTKIRCFHLGKEETFKQMGETKNLRQKNNKLTLFLGQWAVSSLNTKFNTATIDKKPKNDKL